MGALVTNINASKVKCEVNFKTPGATLSEITATSTKTSISLSYKTEGKGTNTTCKNGTEEGVYPNEEEATNTNCNIKELENDTTYYYQVCAKNTGGETCKEGSIKTKLFAEISEVEIGDYISMTPTATSYTISKDLTGYSSDQTINPSELNLWRVIRKNEDGTVEVVSEYVSSALIYFNGKIGYFNFVGALNTIAAQYTNEKYVESTRHIGYSNQTEIITDVSKLDQPTPSWKTNTSKIEQWTECNASIYLCGVDEELGAGDIGYETDYNLVNGVYGTMKAYSLNDRTTAYWLASRHLAQQGQDWDYSGRVVNSIGNQERAYMYWWSRGGLFTQVWQYAVRPILTLKSDVMMLNGDGSFESPYTL